MKSLLFLSLAALASTCLSQQAPRKLSLAEAIRLAELNSPMVDAATADLEASKAGARSAKANLMPQVSANGFASAGNNAGILTSPPTVGPSGLMLVPSGSFLDGNISLMLPILAPTQRAMAASASWAAKAADGDLAESRAEVRLSVTEAYNRILLSRQMVSAEKAKVDATEELVRTTQALYEAGKGIEASVQRAQAELSRAQRALTSARNEEAKAVLDLATVMGADLSTPLDPTDDLVFALHPVDLEECLAKAKASRGLLAAANARREGALSEIRAAEGQRGPQLYGAVMSDATNRRDMGGLTAGLMLSFPLVDGGKISADISKAKSMKAKADAEVRLATLAVEREVRQAWLDVETAKANAASAESAVKAAQSAYDVTAIRVSAGKSILVEQLDALEALTRAKADLAQATFDQVLAVAKLNRATGAEK